MAVHRNATKSTPLGRGVDATTEAECMGQLHLNDRVIKSLATTKAQDYFWDASFQFPGLQFGVRCYGSGRKEFVARYRSPNGSRPQINLGDSRVVSLGEAREKARGLISTLHQGNDPATIRDEYRAAETIEELCKLFMAYMQGLVATGRRRARTLSGYEHTFNSYFIPAWGKRKVCDIRRRDIIAMVDHLQTVKKSPSQAQRIRVTASRLFGFAVEREILSTSPCIGMPRVERLKPRSRVLNEEEIRKVWWACDELSPSACGLFRIILLTGQRPGEVSQLTWDEIEGDVWKLPGERSKNHRGHVIPLSPLALEVLEQTREASRQAKIHSRKPGVEAKDYYDKFAFPSRRQGLATFWLGKICRRLVKVAEVPHFSPHDLRRTASTHLRRLGISKDVVDKILNHVPQDVTGVHYDHYDGLSEKRSALNAWETEIRRLLKE
jgi:integrase